MSNNDLKKTALRSLGYSGSLNDMEVALWKTYAPTKFQYNDLKKAWLRSLGFTQMDVDDAYMAYLKSLGFTGAWNDREYGALRAGLLYFTPLSLFQNGEQGAWYDPSDFSTLFQDSAGTIPVTAVGQPVGRMLDKSGRNNHVIQATATSRPVLQQDFTGRYYLMCDGVDDGMATAGSVDFSTTDKMTVCVGVRKLSDAARATVIELGNAQLNAFRLEAPGAAAPNYTWASAGTTGSQIAVTTFTAPITNVLTGIGDVSGDISIIRGNGAQLGSNPADQGTGNYRSDVLYLFRRGGTSLPFNGRFYGGIIRGAASSALQITQMENYMFNKTGIPALPEPTPPGPYDALVPATNGLQAFSMPITLTGGKEGFIVRIIAKNGAAGVRTLSANIDGTTPLVKLAETNSANNGGPMAAIFGLRGASSGAHTLNISADGACGVAAIRVGELTTMPATWNTGAIITANWDSASIYEIDADIIYNNTSNLVSTQVGWMDTRAYPITTTSGDTEQWSTVQGVTSTGISARFGSSNGAAGELIGSYYLMLYLTNNELNYNYPVMIVAELPGCVV